MIEGVIDIVRIIFAFAPMGSVTWIWGRVDRYLIDNYLSSILNTKLKIEEVIA